MQEKRALTIQSTADRAKVAVWLSNAPDGTHVQFKPSTRSLDQNARLHAMLGEFSKKADHFGDKMNIDAWKILFLEALGVEQKLTRTMDGKGIIPLGWKTSSLSIKQCSELMDLIECEAAQRGIELNDPRYGPKAA